MGIGTAVVLIVAIIIGSFFTAKAIAYLYALSYSIVAVPALMWVGYHKVFKYQWKEIADMWVADILLAITVLLGLLFDAESVIKTALGLWCMLKVPNIWFLLKVLKSG